MSNRSELRKKFATLDALDQESDADDLGELKRGRGREFEQLVADLFDQEGILVRRPYHTSDNRSEQIDGAIEIGNRVALVETKWVQSGLAASDLYAFLGKIQGKLDGTLGVFISREPLKENFLASTRSGRRPCVLIIHGEDVPHLFEDDYCLKTFLKKYIQALSIDNCITYSFVAFAADEADVGQDDTNADELTKELAKRCFEDPELEHQLKLEVAEYSIAERRDVFKGIIKLLPRIYRQADRNKNDFAYQNAVSILKLLLEYEDVDESFIFSRIQLSFREPSFQQLINLTAELYQDVEDHVRREFEEALVDEWNEVFGNFESENTLAQMTEPLFWSFAEETQKDLIGFLVEIRCSSNRRTGYPQRSFAGHILNTKQGENIAESNLRGQVRDAFRKLVESPLSEEYDNWNDYVVRHIKSQFRDYQRVLGNDRYEEAIQETSKAAWYELQSTGGIGNE